MNKIVVALKAVIKVNGRVLIIQRAADAHTGGGTWECPGGKPEFGESLEDALAREIREEVGLEANVGELLFATTFLTDPTRQVVLLTYLCHCDPVASVVLSFEHSDFLWANREELERLLPAGILADWDRHQVVGRIGL